MKDERISNLERIEIGLLLEGIYQQYGCDFRDYALSTIRRRLWKRAREENVTTISALQEKLLHDHTSFQGLFAELSIRTTTMFRDPEFYLMLRNKVIPMLRTYPFIRIWHAGCSTGEEVFSMSILLKEEGLYDRARIYATDLDPEAIQTAKARSLSVENLREYVTNYERAGGNSSLSDYYITEHSRAIFDPSLNANVTFLEHNLVTDHSFMEFNLILCRNVLIYFNKGLKNRVHELLYQSLCRFGVLGLGRRESLDFTCRERSYVPLSDGYKVYRKLR